MWTAGKGSHPRDLAIEFWFHRKDLVTWSKKQEKTPRRKTCFATATIQQINLINTVRFLTWLSNNKMYPTSQRSESRPPTYIISDSMQRNDIKKRPMRSPDDGSKFNKLPVQLFTHLILSHKYPRSHYAKYAELETGAIWFARRVRVTYAQNTPFEKREWTFIFGLNTNPKNSISVTRLSNSKERVTKCE